MRKPGERRHIEARFGISEIERGAEWPDGMQRKVSGLRKPRSIREAEAVLERALECCDHQTGIAHGERPIARAFWPSAIRRKTVENIPGRDEGLLDQLS
jgi:hypothetical protein